MKKFYIFALVATMFAACATDDVNEPSVKIEDLAPETLTVSFEGDESRIQLQDGKTVWTKDDLVSVFYRSNANQKWQFQGATGDRTGNLKRVEMGTATETMNRVVVVYPYAENYYINPETYNVEASLPATQTYVTDSYGVGGNIMVSYGEYNQVVLKSVCGWLKLELTGNGEKISTITLKGNNGEQVAGQLYINSADATATLASEMGNADDAENGAGGNLVFEDTILKEVTLNCGEGVELGAEPTAFYIALPPQTFEKGISLEIVAADGSTMKKSTENKVEIERNHILPMAELVYDGYIPPVYELAYTTNDGQPLDPYTTEGFGANFVENIYDATTGQGALKFDGTITTIPEKAFVACGNLTQINLPTGITAINTEAFSGCKNLAVMNIPQGVKTIGDKAFYNCGAVTDITIPDSVTSIGTSSFEGCGGKAVINCKISGFYKARFTEVVISDNITSIGEYAFYYCTSLTSVTIPDSVTSIYWYTFYYCTSLTSVTIPDSVTSIGDEAFYSCTSLTSVYYTGDLSAWCKMSFGDFDGFYANPLCNGAKLYLNGVEVTDITIPSDITEIKNDTFFGCTSLTSVTMHNRVTSIGETAFFDCTSLTSVTIPDSVTSIGRQAFDCCTSLKRVDIYDLSVWCKIDFNGNPLSNGAKLYLNGSELTDITIPSDITEIKNDTFFGCTSLTSVTIPDSVTSIGDYAFSRCSSLASVTIGNGVTSIGNYAFRGCSSLTSVTIGNSVTSIGEYAFAWCENLTSVTIGNGITSIGDKAFYNCSSLTSVYCKPTTPPTGGYNMFSYDYYYGYKPLGCKIYVPTASVDAYKAASGWSEYAEDIEGYDF